MTDTKQVQSLRLSKDVIRRIKAVCKQKKWTKQQFYDFAIALALETLK